MHLQKLVFSFFLTFLSGISSAATISFTCSGTVETEITVGPDLDQTRRTDTFTDIVDININHEQVTWTVIFGDRDFRFSNSDCFYDKLRFECSRDPITDGGREARFLNAQGAPYLKQSWDITNTQPKALINKTYQGKCYSSNNGDKLW